MHHCLRFRSSRAALVAGALLGLAFLAPRAHAFIIDFDAEGFSGPSLAADTAAAPITVATPYGPVSFSGGAVLNQETFLPADTTSVYYTSYFLGGGANPLTVTFPANIQNFFLHLYNGQTYPDAFTLSDNLGHSNTVTLKPNTAFGNALLSFAAIGNVVTISTPDPNYDLSIDDIGFNQATPGVPELPSWAMMLAGFALVALRMRRHQRRRAAA